MLLPAFRGAPRRAPPHSPACPRGHRHRPFLPRRGGEGGLSGFTDGYRESAPAGAPGRRWGALATAAALLGCAGAALLAGWLSLRAPAAYAARLQGDVDAYVEAVRHWNRGGYAHAWHEAGGGRSDKEPDAPYSLAVRPAASGEAYEGGARLARLRGRPREMNPLPPWATSAAAHVTALVRADEGSLGTAVRAWRQSLGLPLPDGPGALEPWMLEQQFEVSLVRDRGGAGEAWYRLVRTPLAREEVLGRVPGGEAGCRARGGVWFGGWRGRGCVAYWALESVCGVARRGPPAALVDAATGEASAEARAWDDPSRAVGCGPASGWLPARWRRLDPPASAGAMPRVGAGWPGSVGVELRLQGDPLLAGRRALGPSERWEDLRPPAPGVLSASRACLWGGLLAAHAAAGLGALHAARRRRAAQRRKFHLG